MHVTGCTILDCQPVGLLMKDCTNSRVRGNFINAASGTPVKVIGGRDNQIDDR